MVEITDNEFSLLSDYIKQNYGIFLKKEKKALVTGRLQNELNDKNFNSFSDYYKYIVSDNTGVAVTTLINKITTNHTFFMREADHFYYFRDKVLPILASQLKEKDIRCWCAACSTGEESYTLAMILDEFFGAIKSQWDTKVLATDISDKVLNIARKGTYNNDRIEPLPLQWRTQYFKKVDRDNSAITESIKDQVIYRKFNLIDTTFPFRKKFHVIFCRNVMIYFDNSTKIDLINKLYSIMEYGGYLFIGHSESFNRDTTPFKYIMPSVYKKE